MYQCYDATSEEHKEHGLKYSHVVFIHDYQDETPFKLYDEVGPEAAAKYLSQWDYGEYHEMNDTPSHGTSDTTHNVFIPYAGDYILSFNRGLGYIGLDVVLCGCTS